MPAAHPGGTKAKTSDVYAPCITRQQRWDRFFTNHPEVLTTHRYQNGSPPTCACPDCDPNGVRPLADIAVVH